MDNALETPAGGLTIAAAKEWHEQLYDRALQEAPRLRQTLNAGHKAGPAPGAGQGATGGGDLLRKVNALLDGLTELSSQVSSFEDYRWLSHTAVKWQGVFAFLDAPKVVRLEPPSSRLLPSVESAPAPAPEAALTEHELGHWIKTHAELLAYARIARLGRYSTREESDGDNRLAFVYLASDILDGKINFVKRIAPRSYWHLERVWMEDLKQLRAYLLWIDRRGGFGLEPMRKDYFDVCVHLRGMLTEPGIKASDAEFEPVRRRIEGEYLTDGRVDPRSHSRARFLIEDKAYHLYSATGRTDNDQNWDEAEAYVRTFYESIIPAVLEDDPECTLRVLKALQSDPAAPHASCPMINAFEVTLATYFLTPEQVQRAWSSTATPTAGSASIISEAPAPDWPRSFAVPPECRDLFEVRDGLARFRGVMSPDQKAALLAKLVGEPRRVVELLFERSRAVSPDYTL
jgi:hypothetical protein